MIKDLFTDVDIVYKALEFKTDAEIGSNKKTIIDLFTENDDDDQGQLQLLFGDKITFYLKSCTSDGASEPGRDLDRTPGGTGSVKFWRVVMDMEVLKLWCNNELVVTYKFSDSQISGCRSLYVGKDFSRIKFRTEDTATISYTSLG